MIYDQNSVVIYKRRTHFENDLCSVQRLLVELVTPDIRVKAIYAQNNPNGLRNRPLEKREAASTEQMRAMQTALAALDKRLAELE